MPSDVFLVSYPPEMLRRRGSIAVEFHRTKWCSVRWGGFCSPCGWRTCELQAWCHCRSCRWQMARCCGDTDPSAAVQELDRAFTTCLIRVIWVFITVLFLTVWYRSFSLHICLHTAFCILKGDSAASTEYLLCLLYRLHNKSILALCVEPELSWVIYRATQNLLSLQISFFLLQLGITVKSHSNYDFNQFYIFSFPVQI